MARRPARQPEAVPSAADRSAAATAARQLAKAPPGRRAEDAVAGHEQVRAGATSTAALLERRCRRRPRCATLAGRQARARRSLSSDAGDEALPAEPGVDRHDEHEVDVVAHLGEASRAAWPG